MGIKFQCPNGHQLHVKSFLAGKRAKCPHCNAKVMVPQVSEDVASPPSPSRSSAPPSAASLPSVSREPSTLPPPSGEPAGYVRPPGGGQYGPAPPWLLKQWRQEGRIPDEALVWQEGWPEWRLAADVWEEDEPSPVPAVDQETFPSQQSSGVQRRPRKKDHTVLVIALLSAASLILLVVLLWILNRTG